MTRFERLLTASDVTCTSCNHVLTMQELEEFNSSVDEQLQGIVYCHGCAERYLVVCRECSSRYTVEGICGECDAREVNRQVAKDAKRKEKDYEGAECRA